MEKGKPIACVLWSQEGSAMKQTLSRWIVDAISLAYESSGFPSPLGVKAHLTRSVAASKAFLSGVPVQDICDAAGSHSFEGTMVTYIT